MSSCSDWVIYGHSLSEQMEGCAGYVGRGALTIIVLSGFVGFFAIACWAVPAWLERRHRG